MYNMATADDVKPGVYINDGAKWLRQLDNGTPVSLVERDSIVRAESCVIYIPAGSNNSIHLYAHLLWPSFDGEEMCVVYLQPLLKLY